MEDEDRVDGYGDGIGGVCRRETVFESGGTGHGDSVERWGERSREGEHIFDEAGPEDAGSEDVDKATYGALSAWVLWDFHWFKAKDIPLAEARETAPEEDW